MKKYITQAEKLKTVLSLGRFEVIEYGTIFNEIALNYSTPGFQSILSYEEEFNQVTEYKNNGFVCYSFTPYDSDSFDLVKIRQFCKNPFTLINNVIHWI